MSQIHYQNMPDAQISNPACFGASCTVLLCSVVFISFKNLRAAAPAADPGKKKEVRSAIHNLRRSDGWMFVLDS